MGASFFVTPSTHEIESASDEFDNVDLNVQSEYTWFWLLLLLNNFSSVFAFVAVFRGLCRTLFLLDQGLVCSSTCNTETMQDGTFLSYYLLQPSAGGPMLLRVINISALLNHFLLQLANSFAYGDGSTDTVKAIIDAQLDWQFRNMFTALIK